MERNSGNSRMRMRRRARPLLLQNSQHDGREREDTWRLLSESALRQKKNFELFAYLVSCGITIAKRSTKAELVAAIQSSR